MALDSKVRERRIVQHGIFGIKQSRFHSYNDIPTFLHITLHRAFSIKRAFF